MTSTETIFQNLYTLLAGTQLLVNGSPTGGNAFVTTGRTCPQVSAVGQALQPALYIMEGEQDVGEDDIGAPQYELHCAAVAFFRNTSGPSAVYSTQLNNLRDAVIWQMIYRTLASNGTTIIPLNAPSLQSLGGVVYHARVKGRMLANEGLQNNQGFLIFPISILSAL